MNLGCKSPSRLVRALSSENRVPCSFPGFKGSRPARKGASLCCKNALTRKVVFHSAVSYTLLWLCDCTRSRRDTRPSNLSAYTHGARCFGALVPRCHTASVLLRPQCIDTPCIGALAPLVLQSLDASVLWRLRCSDAPCIDTLGALGASMPQSLGTSVPLVLRCLRASVPRCPRYFDVSEPRNICAFSAQTLPASVPLVPRCFGVCSALYSDRHKLQPPSLFRCSWIFWRRYNLPGTDRPRRRVSPNTQPRWPPRKSTQDYRGPPQENIHSRSAGNTPGQRLMAYLDGILRSAPLPEPLDSELHLVLGTLLQISGFQGQALGRSLAGLVVARRQLWLSQARVPDADKWALLDSSIFPRPYLRASCGGDIAKLLPGAGGVSRGGCDASFLCSGMGQYEMLASARVTSGDPDGSNLHCGK
ncbi:UNVERIFIED_CONTAM: hypothetical protein FKN15_071326 [Acipenser sinensis]